MFQTLCVSSGIIWAEDIVLVQIPMIPRVHGTGKPVLWPLCNANGQMTIWCKLNVCYDRITLVVQPKLKHELEFGHIHYGSEGD